MSKQNVKQKYLKIQRKYLYTGKSNKQDSKKQA